jgi:hypothetical protein
MRQIIGLVLAAVLLGGCAAYAGPGGIGASIGDFDNRGPAIAAPAYRARGWGYMRYEERHDGWRRG